MNKNIKIVQLKEKGTEKIVEWTIDQILEEINRDRSAGWTCYDKHDWWDGWSEWCEGDFYYYIKTIERENTMDIKAKAAEVKAYFDGKKSVSYHPNDNTYMYVMDETGLSYDKIHMFPEASDARIHISISKHDYSPKLRNRLAEILGKYVPTEQIKPMEKIYGGGEHLMGVSTNLGWGTIEAICDKHDVIGFVPYLIADLNEAFSMPMHLIVHKHIAVLYQFAQQTRQIDEYNITADDVIKKHPDANSYFYMDGNRKITRDAVNESIAKMNQPPEPKGRRVKAGEMDDIIQHHLNAMIREIQDIVGCDDGGFASMYLDIPQMNNLHTILSNYAEAEYINCNPPITCDSCGQVVPEVAQ